jgi:hypothetical protein
MSIGSVDFVSSTGSKGSKSSKDFIFSAVLVGQKLLRIIEQFELIEPFEPPTTNSPFGGFRGLNSYSLPNQSPYCLQYSNYDLLLLLLHHCQ